MSPLAATKSSSTAASAAMQCFASYWASYWDDEDLFYGHVLGFKGLERTAVMLAVNGFRDAVRAREMLYVGLSRARNLLVVRGDMDLINQVAARLSPVGSVRKFSACRWCRPVPPAPLLLPPRAAIDG